MGHLTWTVLAVLAVCAAGHREEVPLSAEEMEELGVNTLDGSAEDLEGVRIKGFSLDDEYGTEFANLYSEVAQLQSQDKFKEALALAEQAYELVEILDKEQPPELLLSMSALLRGLEQPVKSALKALEGSRAAPDYPRAHLMLGDALLLIVDTRGRVEASTKDRDAATEELLSHSNPALTEQALDALAECVRLDGEQESLNQEDHKRLTFHLGRAFLMLRDFGKAALWLSRCDPNFRYPQTRFLHATSLLELGQPEQALQVLERTPVNVEPEEEGSEEDTRTPVTEDEPEEEEEQAKPGCAFDDAKCAVLAAECLLRMQLEVDDAAHNAALDAKRLSFLHAVLDWEPRVKSMLSPALSLPRLPSGVVEVENLEVESDVTSFLAQEMSFHSSAYSSVPVDVCVSRGTRLFDAWSTKHGVVSEEPTIREERDEEEEEDQEEEEDFSVASRVTCWTPDVSDEWSWVDEALASDNAVVHTMPLFTTDMNYQASLRRLLARLGEVTRLPAALASKFALHRIPSGSTLPRLHACSGSFARDPVLYKVLMPVQGAALEVTFPLLDEQFVLSVGEAVVIPAATSEYLCRGDTLTHIRQAESGDATLMLEISYTTQGGDDKMQEREMGSFFQASAHNCGKDGRSFCVRCADESHAEAREVSQDEGGDEWSCAHRSRVSCTPTTGGDSLCRELIIPLADHLRPTENEMA